MSTTKLNYSSVQTFTVTNLHSLASSPTAGWQSDVVDNTSNLYLDALVQAAVVFPATAPANSKNVFVFAYAGLESGVYSRPASGSQGAITVEDVTTSPLDLKYLGGLPYYVSNADPISGVFSVASAFGGILPPFWGVVIVNHTGATIAASGNTVKWRGVTATVS